MHDISKIFLIFFILFYGLKNDPLYNKEGKPSTYGINQYIKENQEIIIKEYEYRIDTLYDIYIFTENLNKNEDFQDLGIFYSPDYIVITNEEEYIDYEFKNLTKFKQKTLSYTERTVKAVVFHELTHAYINQIYQTMKNPSPEYGMIRIFPTPGYRFGTDFIEEGICEYVVYYLNETTPIKNITAPKTEEDLLDPKNKVTNIYYYSVVFLKNFFEKHGVKNGIEILLSNRPPSNEEILNPKIFFNRLN